MVKPKKGYIVGVGSRLDNLQTGLDVIGMTEIPFVSQGADLASGVISLATGDYVGAALSVGGLIPGVGQATGALKMARRAGKVMDAASNVKGAGKLLELTKKVDSVPTYKGTGKLLDITKKTESPKPKQSIAKNSEVDAKPTKRERVKEKEDIKVENAVQKPEVEKKLDIRDGITNRIEGQGLEDAIVKNESMYSLPKNVQKENYQKAIWQIEQGKPFYNPTGVMPKNRIFPNINPRPDMGI